MDESQIQLFRKIYVPTGDNSDLLVENHIQMIPYILKEGYNIATMEDVAKLRLEGMVEEGVGTATTVVFNKEGNLKIIADGKPFIDMANSKNVNYDMSPGSCFFQLNDDEYNAIDQQEFTFKQYQKIQNDTYKHTKKVNRRLKKKTDLEKNQARGEIIKKHPLWQAAMNHNQPVLNDYVDLVVANINPYRSLMDDLKNPSEREVVDNLKKGNWNIKNTMSNLGLNNVSEGSSNYFINHMARIPIVGIKYKI